MSKYRITIKSRAIGRDLSYSEKISMNETSLFQHNSHVKAWRWYKFMLGQPDPYGNWAAKPIGEWWK